jgi:membrane protease YdiL (CAAX protease family)/mannose-6-phosphate isomerase-like protein (cupin superfamily)
LVSSSSVVQVAKKVFIGFAAVAISVALFKFMLMPAIEYCFQPGPGVATFIRRRGILVFAVLGYWIHIRFYEKRPAAELRVKPLGILAGTLSGAALISITTLLLFTFGAYEIVAYRGLHVELFEIAGVILLAGVLEEIVFRGVLFRIMEEAWGTMPSLCLSSLIFAVSHLWNFEAGVGAYILMVTVASATLISAFWTVIFVRSRNLWVVATHHAAWNFAIILSGAPLSGLDEWQGAAPWETRYHGPTWLTGGIFGPEDSVITIAVMAISLWALLHATTKKAGLIRSRLASKSDDVRILLPAMQQPMALRKVAASLAELWSPRVLAELDESYVKVAKVQGTFGWHSHEQEDELFLVLKGSLRIEMEAGAVELAEGEFFIVPKGARHNPSAHDECLLMLLERRSTLHSGGAVNEKSRSLAQQLRPVPQAADTATA